jgi:quinol monooxygenase YgiN
MKSIPVLIALSLLPCSAASMAQPVVGSAGNGAKGPLYSIAHFDVLPMAMGRVDFLQSGYALLFRYRDQSRADRGLQSFRILNLVPPTTNHSEIVQTWNSYEDYLNHLTQPHTIAFRFNVQNNPDLGDLCCVGSPIDDRQYRLVQSLGTPWPSIVIPSIVGPAGPLFVISYVEFQPRANVAAGQSQLVAYATATWQGNGTSLLSFSTLRQLERPNRYAILEIWSNQKNYNAWQRSAATLSLLTNIKPLLEAPLDHRLTSLCGETFVANIGCTAP